EAASTLFLFAVAELLESHSMDRARNAIRKLMELSPAEATVRRDGTDARVPVSEIDVGETVIVRPGEKIAVDGLVAAGQSSVNQAAITGEAMPVDVAVGDSVFAGTINVQGALEVRSEKPASDTTLARIIHAVEEAQATRAPSQTFVDRFARIYTPGVVMAAIAVAILPPLAGFGSFEMWVYRALTMLVVACPCALVISTPVTIVSGLARAARGGVLIKGGAYLEAAGAITTICFDKTGTLTRGEPVVTDIAPLGRLSEKDVLAAAAAVERHSEHPLARAVLAAAAERDIPIPESTDFAALSGRGARALVNGATVMLGNERLAKEIGALQPEVTGLLSRFAEAGKSVVLVTRGGEAIGAIGIADQTRPNARDALLELRAAGISRLLMLTGDNEGTARAIARELGLDSYYAELLPDDKVRVVRELEEKGERLIFVGDGVNDAPALAAATIGVAMGAVGTDVALETADVALMADDLSKLAFLVRLSRATLRVLRQNIAFAIAVKAVFLVLALGGWATLWMAIAADMGASLAVVANGLRVLRIDDGN
ncbi:MAG: heavy metal translocating P-type ATPase, partial [Gemmatimonadaceae bacterium]